MISVICFCSFCGSFLFYECCWNELSVNIVKTYQELGPVISVCNFKEGARELCFRCIHNPRPYVINCSMQLCHHPQREHLLFFSITISSTGFACIVKWDWWKHPGHYSRCCLANFCALTSTKMSSRSSRLTLASPETINPLAGVVPACTGSPGSQRCQLTAVPIPFPFLSIYFGSKSTPISNRIWLLPSVCVCVSQRKREVLEVEGWKGKENTILTDLSPWPSYSTSISQIICRA